MKISFDQFSNLVEMAALVVGGLWAAWSFHKLQKARGAEVGINVEVATLRKLQLEIENDKRRHLREQPALGIALEAHEVIDASETSGSVLCVTATLKNEGELNLEVMFDESALTVGRLVHDEHHRQSVKDLRRSSHWYLAPDGKKGEAFLAERIFRIGQTRRIPFAVQLRDAGVYLVQFQATYNKVPFDDEKASRREPVAITALEQTIYVATGQPADTRTT